MGNVITNSGAIRNIPPHAAPGAMELDCSERPALFYPQASAPFPEARLRATLFQRGENRPLGRWSFAAQPVALSWEKGELVLKTRDGEIIPFAPEARASVRGAPLTLSLQAEHDGAPQGAASWLPLHASAEARRLYEEDKRRIWSAAAGSGFPPHLGPGDETVRIVARNVMLNDAVGNFALGMAATLPRSGRQARLYAYVSCAELAGLVSSIGDLKRDIKPGDIIYYHYSTEDEFLPAIADLTQVRKILYYHNTTPGRWFRELFPDFADALDRARKQYALFSAFDAAAANSLFSLQDIRPYLSPGAPAGVFPPSMNLDRLTRLTPRSVRLPEAANIILWVGRVAPHKRPELALALFESLSRLRDDAILVMVVGGRGDFPIYAEALGGRLAALPSEIRARICRLEGLSDEQMAWLYRRASLLLCTSGHEGYCLPVREALNFDVPVAYCPQPAVAETLAGRGTQLPEDIKAAANTLCALLDIGPGCLA